MLVRDFGVDYVQYADTGDFFKATFRRPLLAAICFPFVVLLITRYLTAVKDGSPIFGSILAVVTGLGILLFISGFVGKWEIPSIRAPHNHNARLKLRGVASEIEGLSVITATESYVFFHKQDGDA